MKEFTNSGAGLLWKSVALVAGIAAEILTASPADIDPSFDVGFGSQGAVRAVAIDSSNRLVVAGGFTSFNGTDAGRILRLLENGAVDPDFDAGSGANGEIKAIEILPDQRILLGGQFTSFDGTATRGLVLLLPNGSVDGTFVSGFSSDGFSVGVTCLESLPGGAIMVGGYFTRYAGSPAGRYAFITPSGTPAPGYAAGAGADSHVFDIDVQPNGKILLCGFFDTVAGHPSACVARLNGNGSVDTTFGTGSQLGAVAYSVEGQTDGKVIVGGSFSNFFGLGQRYLGRLNPDGKLDESYLGNAGPDLNVYGLTLDSEGRLLVAGQFSDYRGEPMAGLGRLLADGSRDPSFSFDRIVSASFFQEYPVDAGGRVLCYGWSNFFNDPDEVNLLRLEGGDWEPGEAWLFEHFGTDSATGAAAWDAEPAGDGISNLEKYALGHVGDPRQSAVLWGDGGLLEDVWTADTTSGFGYSTILSRTDVTVVPEWSPFLEGWTGEGLEVTEVERDGEKVRWKVTLPVPSDRAFFRVRTEWAD